MKRILWSMILFILPLTNIQAKDAAQVLQNFAFDKVESQLTQPTGGSVPFAPETSPNLAAPQPIASDPVLTIRQQADQLSADLKQKQEYYRFWEVIALTLMGSLSLTVVLWFMERRDNSTPKEMISASGVTLIIFATLLLVILADTDQQLTAAAGIFGAMAGYVFRGITEQNEVGTRETATRKTEITNPGDVMQNKPTSNTDHTEQKTDVTKNTGKASPRKDEVTPMMVPDDNFDPLSQDVVIEMIKDDDFDDKKKP